MRKVFFIAINALLILVPHAQIFCASKLNALALLARTPKLNLSISSPNLKIIPKKAKTHDPEKMRKYGPADEYAKHKRQEMAALLLAAALYAIGAYTQKQEFQKDIRPWRPKHQ